MMETTDTFKPRDYQLPIMDAIINRGYKRVIAILPRRAGKDLTAINICKILMIQNTINVFYCLPTFSSGRRIIWDAMTSDGARVIDYFPKELVHSKNEQLMRIRLKNGSTFSIIGSDSYDQTLVGTNFNFIVFSEFALSNPDSYRFAKPIMNESGAGCLIISTPRGRTNGLYDLWKIAQNRPDSWFTYKLNVEQTKHIPIKTIEDEIASGEISRDLALQEYWTDFSFGCEGAYYSKYMDAMYREERIGTVKWDPCLPVIVSMDLGVRDSTTLIFAQVTNDGTIRIIDYYENTKEGLPHYAKVIKSKEYLYKEFICPHDIRVRELGSGNTRLNTLRDLGVSPITVCDNIPIEDGIEACRNILPKCFIDKENCAQLIKALENYRQEFDPKKKVYRPRPLHNWASHACDAFRYFCVSLPKLSDSMTPEQIDKNFQESRLGHQTDLPPFFRDDTRGYY